MTPAQRGAMFSKLRAQATGGIPVVGPTRPAPLRPSAGQTARPTRPAVPRLGGLRVRLPALPRLTMGASPPLPRVAGLARLSNVHHTAPTSRATRDYGR